MDFLRAENKIRDFKGFNSLNWKRIWRRRLAQLQSPNRLFPKKSSSGSPFLSFSPALAIGFFILVIGFVLTAGIVIAVFSKDLPRPDQVVRSEGFATKIFDRNGKLIYDVFKKEKRTPVVLSDVPLYLREATIAIEDKDFYKHQGFDIRGWLRIIYYVFRYRKLTGGSTLTQQLVKNVLLTNERTVSRKIKEFILALQIESRYSKDEILQMYLNEAPFGGTTWGVAEASETYFGKSVSDLNLVESAILAGLPQRPSYYSPFGSEPKAYVGRAIQVLRRMREDGKITSEQEKEAAELLPNYQFNQSSGTIKAPHFVMYVKKLLEEKYGENLVEEGGLRVTTTLDLDFQEKAQATLAAEIAKVEKIHITNGAAIVMEPDSGQILAMIGSKNYDDPDYDGKVNVVLSLRQPGSAIKPITYAAALKKGYPLSTVLMDVKTSFPGGTDKPDYQPENYDLKEHGPLQLRYALGNSINIVAVKLLALVGVNSMLETAYDMGMTSLEPTQENLQRLGLSVTLGGGEVRLLDLASAYSAFANGGLKVKPVAILRVTDKDGNIIEEYADYPKKQVLTAEESFLISHVLADNNARLLTFGETNSLNIPGRQVAAKTGTTNDKRDNWTIGWTPQVIVGVWVGNNDNSPMKQLASGISGAAPIWRKIILDYLNNQPVVDFNVPESLVTQDVDIISGYKSHDDFPSRMEYFIRGTEPVEKDLIHLKMKVCKLSGKIATPVDIARGDFEEREFLVFKESDPTASETGPNRWQEAIDKWVSGQLDSKYRPPTELCETKNQIEIKILNPEEHSQVSNRFTVKVEPISLNQISKVEIFIDGSLKETVTGSPFERDFNLSDGTHILKVKVQDNQGNSGEREIKFGVNVPWDFVPPTSTPIPSPTSSPSPTLTPIPTP